MLNIHKASAGSGKTYTLTYNYIKLLLGVGDEQGNYRLASDRKRHRAILAITFTNKATDEMKRRIVQQLAMLAHVDAVKGGRSDYEARLCDELGCDSTQLANAARDALFSLLGDYSFFNVSTIDAFFQTVLRTFAREAELTGNYEVELNEKNAIAIGVSEMLSSINRATPEESRRSGDMRMLIAWLEQYMLSKIEAGETYNIFNRGSRFNGELVDFVNSALSEVYKLNAKEIQDYLADKSKISEFAKKLNSEITEIPKIISSEATRVCEAIEREGLAGSVNYHLMNRLREWSIGGVRDLNMTVIKAAANPDARYKVRQAQLFSADLDDAIGRLLNDCIALTKRYNTYKLMRANVYNLGLIGDIVHHALEVQKENNSIVLSDTNDILRRIINQEEAPFIYERMGVRLRHFLIDEFQDTSRLQWINLGALVRESLSTGNDNLIIGDEKQSIYRFRNSDPKLLSYDVPKEFERDSRLFGDSVEENTNWRSAREIVQFNNTLFTALMSRIELKEVVEHYAGVVQNIAKKEMKGYVKAIPCGDDALDDMVEEIKRQLKQGYRQGDIAVLVHKWTQGSAVIERLLEAKLEDEELRNLRVLSDDSLAISAAPSVRKIVSVLRFIDARQPLDGETPTPQQLIARLVNRYEYFSSEGDDAACALERAFVDDTPDELAMEAADMTCINLPSLVERIIGRYVDADTLSRENVYVCAFQDMVIDFCSHADADIHSFIKWWDATGSSSKLSTPASLDAIKVMTIHKSKGLEFPCVHIPFCGLPHNRQSDIAWFGTRNAEGSLIDDFVRDGFYKDCVPPFVPLSVGKALEGTMFDSRYKEIVSEKYVDRLNLLYVACTRAVNELMFYYTPVKKIKTEQLDGTSLPTTDFLLANAFSVADAAFCSNNEPLSGLLAPLKNHVDSCDLFEFGEAVDHKAEERKEPMVEMPAYYSYDNEGIWEMSRIEDLEDMERPRRRGIVLHSIMSGVRNRSDVERAVRRRAARGFIDDDEIDGYIAELSEALSDERVDEWFEGYRRLLRESTIAVPTGDGVRNYRPDRVVWTSQGTIDVIDYKFGEEEPSGYIRQVKGYMRLISKIYPDVEVRGFLWYPLQKRITRV